MTDIKAHRSRFWDGRTGNLGTSIQPNDALSSTARAGLVFRLLLKFDYYHFEWRVADILW